MGRPTQSPGPGLLFVTGCFWDNGHLYREDQSSPAPGLRCLNWLDARGGLEPALVLGEFSPGVAGGGGPDPSLRLFSPLRRRQPQLLSESGPRPARALVLRERRGRHPREGALSGRALPRYPLRTQGDPRPRPNWKLPVTPSAHVRPPVAGRTAPPPLHLIRQGCLQAAGSKAHWQRPPLRSELILLERL